MADKDFVIENNCLKQYTGNEEHVVIPEGVTAIYFDVFKGCQSLRSITLPQTLEAIGMEAFSGCTGLTEIVIPPKVRHIGQGAFKGCTRLAEISIPAETKDLAWDTFADTPWEKKQGDMVIINKMLVRYNGTDAQPVIPEGVEEIISHAFGGRSTLCSLSIPASVKQVWFGAFEHCANLKQLTVDPQNEHYRSEGNCIIQGTAIKHGCAGSVIPEGITELLNGAFAGCWGLERLVIPESVVKLPEYSFSECPDLTSVVVKNGKACLQQDGKICLKFVGSEKLHKLSVEGADFTACDTKIKLPMLYAFLDEPEQYSKEQTAAYIKYMTTQRKRLLQKAVEEEHVAVFAGYQAMGIVIPPALRDELIEQAASQQKTESLSWLIDYKERTADKKKEEKAAEHVEAQQLENPWMAKFLKADWSWAACADGTVEITQYKGKDTDVTVPPMVGKKPVSRISVSAFANCTGVESVTIPDSVKSIESWAFYGCSGLRELVIPEGFIHFASDAFQFAAALRAQDGMVVMNHVLVRYMHGRTNPLIPNQNEKLDIVIPEDVKYIADYAFADCNMLESITIPEGVVCIGRGAFRGCGIEKMEIPDSVKEIGQEIFEACGRLKNVTLPKHLKITKKLLGIVGKNVEVIRR